MSVLNQPNNVEAKKLKKLQHDLKTRFLLCSRLFIFKSIQLFAYNFGLLFWGVCIKPNDGLSFLLNENHEERKQERKSTKFLRKEITEKLVTQETTPTASK